MTTDWSVAQHLETLRRRLLDLSNRNKFLNFKFSERSRTQIRIGEGGPDSLCILDAIFDALEEGKALTITSLPEPPEKLLSKSDREFGDRLEKARRQDKKYQKLSESLDLAVLELDDLEFEMREAAEEAESESEIKTEAKKLSSEELAAKTPESNAAKAYLLKLVEIQKLEQDLHTLDQKLKRTVRAALKKEMRAKHLKQLGIKLNYDLPSISTTEPEAKSRARQKNLQTLLYADELERKIAGLRDGARKSLQESGLNTLYLAFGMLEWCESDRTDKRFAPLFLYPVTLERQKQNNQLVYHIQSSGEGPEENFSLRERLQRDHGVILPTFQAIAEDDDEDSGGESDGSDSENGHKEEIATDTPASYFEQVTDAIRPCGQWRVRQSLTLSLFSFGGIVLFQDLNPERWPEDASILNHPLLEAMLCGQDQDDSENNGDDPQVAIAPDYAVDDPAIAKKAPLLITDADTSQFSAVVDAMNGKNLVIEGPPGTGKSQTITNLIAVTLANGKNVLFVAQKKAALDVVYNRLANAGLENYCLDIHSTRDSRQSFYDTLKRRVEQERPKNVSRSLKQQQKECEKLKQQLSHYVTILNQPFGKGEETIQEIFWAVQRANQDLEDISGPSGLSSVCDEGAIAMTNGDFQRKCQHLETFSQRYAFLVQKHRVLSHHPWFGLTNHQLSPIEQSDLCASASQWSEALTNLQVSVQEAMATFDLDHPLTLGYPEELYQALTACPTLEPLVATGLLSTLQKRSAQQSVATFIDTVSQYQQDKRSLLQFFTKNVRSASLVALVPSMGDLQHSDGHTLEAIATALDSLRKEVPGLCKQDSSDRLNKAKATCTQLNELQADLEEKYRLDAWKSPEQMASYAASLRQSNVLSFLFNGRYRRAKKLWARIQKTSQKRSDTEISDIFMAISQFQNQRDNFLNDSELKDACNPHFKGLETEFGHLISVNKFCQKLNLDYENIEQQKQRIKSSDTINLLDNFYQQEQTDIKQLAATHQFAQAVTESTLPPPIQTQLLTTNAAQIIEDIQATAELLAETLQDEKTERQRFLQQAKPDSQAMFQVEDLQTQTIGHIVQRLERATAAPDDLPDWISYHQAYQNVVDDGLQPLIESFEREALSMEDLAIVYPSVFYRSLLRLAYQEYPDLQNLSGTDQAQGREQFQQADQKLLDLHQRQLAAQLGKRTIAPGKGGSRRKSEWTNQALIQNEIAKQRRHISQRSLFQRASVALQQLKPCWMMSPASVAQFIPPGVVSFDMVVIDEASQMRPEEAVGAIARAKSGDSRRRSQTATPHKFLSYPPRRRRRGRPHEPRRYA
ncbi:MAG: DUF4011 domain-containing protein [Cyanobacteria bacterium P01_F01_bin.150]